MVILDEHGIMEALRQENERSINQLKNFINELYSVELDLYLPLFEFEPYRGRSLETVISKIREECTEENIKNMFGVPITKNYYLPADALRKVSKFYLGHNTSFTSKRLYIAHFLSHNLKVSAQIMKESIVGNEREIIEGAIITNIPNLELHDILLDLVKEMDDLHKIYLSR